MTRFKIYKELTNGISGTKKPLVALSFLKLWALGIGLVPPLLYAYLVNSVMIGKNINKLWAIICAYILIYILLTVGIVLSKKFSNRLILKYDMKIKHKLLKKYTNIDSMSYNKFSTGDVKSRIENDTVVAESFFIDYFLEFYYDISYSFVLAIILLCLNWKLALLSFIFIPMTFVVVNFLGKKTKQAGEKLWNINTKYETFLHMTFQNWKDVKINNLEDKLFEELNVYYKKIRRIWFLNQIYWHLGLSFSFFQRNFITQMFLYFVGGLFVIKGYSEVGTVLVFINFYGQFYGFIKNICDSIIGLKNDSVNIEKVIEILNLQTDEKGNIHNMGSDIIAKNLSFKYQDNEEFVLKNILFEVKNGEHLAIVGESGSGKSTIAKILSGQITPQKGNILIGGIDINTIDSKSISKKISIVMQEPTLFNLTVRENLLMVKPEAKEEELTECCRKASIYDFIETLPNKFDTIIGEKGVKLSGGQKQRLSIARAFLQNNDIIIFDESTSALDSEKERDIINEIKNLSKDKTLISIAHRLSTIQSCDKVIVIKDGFIMAEGTHEELKGKNEDYDFLFEKQYNNFHDML